MTNVLRKLQHVSLLFHPICSALMMITGSTKTFAICRWLHANSSAKTL